MAFKLWEKRDAAELTTVDVDSESQTQSKSEHEKFVGEDGVVYEGHQLKYRDEWNPDGLRPPTDEESATLRRVLGHAPYVCYLICLIEFAERGSYYGVSGILSNFIQRPMPKGGNGWGAPPRGTQETAGALNLGLQTSSALTLLLTFLAYVTPLYGGFVADAKIGKMKAIWIGVIIGAIAHVLLIIASIPSVMTGGHALAPTILGIITLAIGTGFIKPNLLPLLMDQYQEKTDVVKVLPTGEKVIVAREATLERMTLVFYWAINVGAFLQLATSYCEKRVGFWLAYFVPAVMYMLLPIVLLFLGNKMVRMSPKGSILSDTCKVAHLTFFRGNVIKRYRNGTLWEYATPSAMLLRGEHFYKEKKQSPITWTDQFVLDVKQTVNSSKIFLYYVIFNLADGGIGGIENSQAAGMTTNGVPNDLFNNFNPLTIIVFIPFLDYGVYPLLRRWKINFKPVYRIFLGFVCAGMSQVAGAVIQWKVYKTSPCGYYASDCDIGTGVSPISAWQDVSLYILSAVGECFAMTTGYEVAYIRSPTQMKSLVMALFLFTSALSAALGEICTASLVDPHLIWPFVGVAVATIVAAIVFLIHFWNLDKVMEQERIIREAMMERESEVLKAIKSNASVRSDETDVHLNLVDVVPIRSVTK